MQLQFYQFGKPMPDITIKSFKEFEERLNLSIARMKAIPEEYYEPMYGSIIRQLEAVREWTRGGIRPKQEDINKLTFGMMASRALYDTDSELAKELFEIADFLRCWLQYIKRILIPKQNGTDVAWVFFQL